jgi:CheY-like chemotaxis protein
MPRRSKKMSIEERLKKIEKRLAALEKGQDQRPDVLKMDLTLPEADIDGLHFNETKVHAVFEKQEDGWYYSRDILFLSARNVKNDNSRDILTEYLNCDEVRTQIGIVVNEYFDNIEITLSQKSQGLKKYNGVDWWYWLADPYAGSAAYFCGVYAGGYAGTHGASAVGGCAPMFRVV